MSVLARIKGETGDLLVNGEIIEVEVSGTTVSFGKNGELLVGEIIEDDSLEKEVRNYSDGRFAIRGTLIEVDDI